MDNLTTTAMRRHRPSTRTMLRAGSTVMMKPRKDGFTLIEMLVVLVIIGVLTGITLSAMHNIGRSTALHSASRQIADQINKARNYALVNGTYVYMVVATDQTTSSPNYPFTAFG